MCKRLSQHKGTVLDVSIEERQQWLKENEGKGPLDYIKWRIAELDDDNINLDNVPCYGCNHPLVHQKCLRVCNEYATFLS